MSLPFKQLLDNHYQWPSEYIFKFIVPLAQVSQVAEFLTLATQEHNHLQKSLTDPQNWLSYKSSKNGKYCSLTARIVVPSSEVVIRVYSDAKTIEGLIAL